MSVWERLYEATGIGFPAAVRDFLETPPELGETNLEPLRPLEMLEGVYLCGLHYDLFPLVGNGAGDYLCLRVGPEGEAREIVLFVHDDWSFCLPYGHTLAEALLVHGAQAEPAERSQPLLRWCLSRLDTEPASVERFAAALDGDDLAAVLTAQGVGRAVLCAPPQPQLRQTRLVIRDRRFLDYYDLGEVLEPLFAQGQLWYDLKGLPSAVRAVLDKDFGPKVLEPDFSEHECGAQSVVAQRPDIGWAWLVLADVAGWRGDQDAAREHVARAARCLRHTFGSYGPFYLQGVRSCLRETDAVTRHFLEGDARSMGEHWLALAGEAEEAGDWSLAWDAWYRRALHLPSSDIPVEGQLDVLTLVALEGGFHCWEKLGQRRLDAEGGA